MKAFAIKRWNETFETAASRKLRRLDYVGMPVDHGSMRFRALMQNMKGAAAFGHFIAIVQWATTLPCRGLLVRSGRPLTLEQIAVCSNIAPRALKKTWKLLINHESEGGVAWIEEVEFSAAHPPYACYWATPNPPRISHRSASDPPVISQEPPGIPLALKTHPSKKPIQETHPPIRQIDGECPRTEQVPVRTVLLWAECRPIYDAYPNRRRGSQGEAVRFIAKAVGEIVTPDGSVPLVWLLARVKAYASSWAATHEGGRYAITLEKWLEDGHYARADADWSDPNQDAGASPAASALDRAKQRERAAKAPENAHDGA